ncbi:AraC family ligand binding domain-containing protein [Pseudomonas sp. ZB1P45]|uniref:AraC family ligand binding domain-containing protein n=1 Tax=Pseudomonas frigoris TaxID=3398356 RepID=UPI0039F0746A
MFVGPGVMLSARAKHQSTPGKVFLLEPGDIHDGEAPTEDGFTYRMLYLDPQWLKRELSAVFDETAEPLVR